MPTLTTTRKVNPSQLSHEVGRLPLRATGPDEDGRTTLHVEGLSDAALSAAVEAHKADPAWTDPQAPPPPPDPDAEFRAALGAATTVAQLRDALLGKAGPGAQARRPTGT